MVVSLKCGHLFGQSCILTWLESTKTRFCPTCRAAATKQHLRPVQASVIVAVDRTKLEQLERQLQAEKFLRAKVRCGACCIGGMPRQCHHLNFPLLPPD